MRTMSSIKNDLALMLGFDPDRIVIMEILFMPVERVRIRILETDLDEYGNELLLKDGSIKIKPEEFEFHESLVLQNLRTIQ